MASSPTRYNSRLGAKGLNPNTTYKAHIRSGHKSRLTCPRCYNNVSSKLRKLRANRVFCEVCGLEFNSSESL